MYFKPLSNLAHLFSFHKVTVKARMSKHSINKSTLVVCSKNANLVRNKA